MTTTTTTMTTTSPFPPPVEDLTNPKLLHRNRLSPRAYFLPSKNNRISLNGRWHFSYFGTPRDAWASLAANATTWNDIQVPGHWQLQGYGRPQYTNTRFPFPVDPPNVPTANPTGVYQRSIQIPSTWTAGISPANVRLRFDGVDSSYHVYLNDTLIGYNQGGRNAAEFDITNYVAATQGQSIRLLVIVYQWSDGSYLEDQDQWWLSGIFRDVHVLAFPSRAHIEDYKVETQLDSQYHDATLNVDVKYEASVSEDMSLHFELSEPNSRDVLAGDSTSFRTTADGSASYRCKLQVANPKKWTAETPCLYDLRIRLSNAQGEEIHSVNQRVGFRQVEIIKGNIAVNGVPILLNGVNRHDHHPRFGRSVPLTFIRRDLVLMKQHNINAIRCSHYPNRPELYNLCDEIGLWVMDEADLECHGFFDAVSRDLNFPDWIGYHEKKYKCLPLAAKYTSDNPEWREAYLDRIQRLVRANQNHPSIIIWSLGNEAFYGSNHQAMYDWIKNYDSTRPVHYEADKNAVSADMYSYMYLSMQKLKHYADIEGDQFAKPVVVCEYAHSKGNGPGNLQEYQDLFRTKRRLQGGYVWEWADHGLINTHEGKEYFAYGGDFGETLHDSKYCMDGIVNSNHDPTPGLVEFKKVIEPVEVTKKDENTLNVKNWYDFVDLSHCVANWKVVKCSPSMQEEVILASGTIQIPQIGPHQQIVVRSPFKDLAQHPVNPGDHVYGHLNFTLKESTTWANLGYEIAWAQFQLLKSEYVSRLIAPSGQLAVENSVPGRIVIAGPNFNIHFDTTFGHITQWVAGGRSLLHKDGGPKLGIWRPPTDNDLAGHALQWQKHGLDALEVANVACSSVEHDNSVEVTIKYRLAPPVVFSGFSVTAIYTVDGSGGLSIDVEMSPIRDNPASLPRIGIDLSLSQDFDHVVWHGKGPHQSYKDSSASARQGIFTSKISDLDFLYEVPQENGNRSDVEWVSILDANGSGLTARFKDTKFNFQASHYYPDNITKARHIYELVPQPTTYLRLDYDHHGLGNASINPYILPDYELKNKPTSFTVELRWTD